MINRLIKYIINNKALSIITIQTLILFIHLLFPDFRLPNLFNLDLIRINIIEEYAKQVFYATFVSLIFYYFIDERTKKRREKLILNSLRSSIEIAINQINAYWQMYYKNHTDDDFEYNNPNLKFENFKNSKYFPKNRLNYSRFLETKSSNEKTLVVSLEIFNNSDLLFKLLDSIEFNIKKINDFSTNDTPERLLNILRKILLSNLFGFLNDLKSYNDKYMQYEHYGKDTLNKELGEIIEELKELLKICKDYNLNINIIDRKAIRSHPTSQ